MQNLGFNQDNIGNHFCDGASEKKEDANLCSPFIYYSIIDVHLIDVVANEMPC